MLYTIRRSAFYATSVKNMRVGPSEKLLVCLHLPPVAPRHEIYLARPMTFFCPAFRYFVRLSAQKQLIFTVNYHVPGNNTL
jgi:hypothetical protein